MIKKDHDVTFLIMMFGVVISIKAIAVWYLGGELMMMQINQNYERKCERLLENKQFRFVGIINKLGNLIAGGFRREITPFETEEKNRMMYMQMVLEVSMRKEFDETLGEIDYIASKRKNVLMISIPINEELLLISVNPKSITDEIVSKAIKIFKNSEENYGV